MDGLWEGIFRYLEQNPSSLGGVFVGVVLVSIVSTMIFTRLLNLMSASDNSNSDMAKAVITVAQTNTLLENLLREIVGTQQAQTLKLDIIDSTTKDTNIIIRQRYNHLAQRYRNREAQYLAAQKRLTAYEQFITGTHRLVIAQHRKLNQLENGQNKTLTPLPSAYTANYKRIIRGKSNGTIQ